MRVPGDQAGLDALTIADAAWSYRFVVEFEHGGDTGSAQQVMAEIAPHTFTLRHIGTFMSLPLSYVAK